MKSRKKYRHKRRVFIVTFVISLLILFSLAVILPLLLIRKGTYSTTIKPIPILRWNTTGITVAGILNKAGPANNTLFNPFDVALDYANNLYVADRHNNRIQKFLFGSLMGQTIAGNTTADSTPTQLYYPSGVAVDSNQNIYISDSYNYRAVYWSQGATFGIRIGGMHISFD